MSKVRPNIEKIRNNTVFGVGREEDVPTLLAYIDELENMPLVHTVVKLQEENERAYQMNSDMALTLIEKSNEIERLRELFKQLQKVTDQARYFPVEYEDFVQRIVRQALEG